jgi:hypothetical protein
MSAARKHNEVNERVMQAHERKELKEENARLLKLQRPAKFKAIKRRTTRESDMLSADMFPFTA